MEKENTINVVFISGKVGNGKDSVAEILKTFYGYEVFRYADDLKEMLYTYANWDGKKDIKGRTLLQSAGNAIRKYNNDVWIDRLFHEHITEYLINNERYYDIDKPVVVNICIADVRYYNEIEKMIYLINHLTFLLENYTMNFKLIRINGKNHAEDERKMNDATKNDESETSLDDVTKFPCDVSYIDNNSSLAALKNSVDVIMNPNLKAPKKSLAKIQNNVESMYCCEDCDCLKKKAACLVLDASGILKI